MNTKEKIKKAKSRLRKIGIGAMTALTLGTGGLNASAQNNASGERGGDAKEYVVARPSSVQAPVTGVSPKEAFDILVSRLKADGYSNNDIGTAMYSCAKALTGDKSATKMLKSEKQMEIALEICRVAKDVVDYGDMVGDKDVRLDVISQAKRVAKEMGAEETVQMRQVPKENLKYGVSSLEYAIKDGQVLMQGNISGNLNPILPPMYQHEDGSYSIGTTKSSSISMVNNIATMNMKKVIMNQVVANDMQIMAKESGRELTESERNFIERHQQTMKDWGLSVQKDGTLYQTKGGKAGRGLTAKGKHVNSNLSLNTRSK